MLSADLPADFDSASGDVIGRLHSRCVFVTRKYSNRFGSQLSKHNKTIPQHLHNTRAILHSKTSLHICLTTTVRHNLPQRTQDCNIQRSFLFTADHVAH
jgi:hypothetical protein